MPTKKGSADKAFFELLERVSSLSPRSFGEFNAAAGAVMERLRAFGIVKAEYTMSLTTGIPFSDNLPKGGALLDGAPDMSAEPMRFQYVFDRGGMISFLAYFDDGAVSDPEAARLKLNVFFRQLYFVISELISELTYKRLTTTDLATGISTLPAFMQFAGMLLATGKASDYTALNFNIRNFRSIHKSLTYLEGNEVMAGYCRKVCSAITKREMIARLGGDNFVALILDEHTDYFYDILQNMAITYYKEGKPITFRFGATIGAAKLDTERSPGDVMMHITSAYQGARENKIAISYYDNNLNLALMEKKIILSNFHKALAAHEFFVMYQPKVDVNTRTLAGAEALVRWKHGDSYIMPASFISALESDGCICALDFYMLDKVCWFLKKMMFEGVEPVKISVNFSKRHLSNNKLVEEIAEVIDSYDIPHNLIEVELTESEDFHNQGVMKDVVDELNALGIKTSIDDFGTGYSSLGMLRTLRLDTLKIDRSFIPVDIHNHEDKNMLMFKGVVNLAKSLGLTIVAEGVETPAQLKLIENMECDIVQGYIFDKPLSEEQFIERLRQKDYYNLL